MYCQSCGAERQPGLNYCNRCGAAASVAPSQALAPIELGGPFRVIGLTIGLTTVIGLAILFIGLGGLSSGGNGDLLAWIGFLGFVTLLGIDLALVRLLSRLLKSTQESGRPIQIGKAKAKELRPAQTGPVFPDRMSSVTEHTTRTFSPIYKEPRT
ncbi:hypothetical protein BH18ACI2_BH18ACI2_01260 [soil metagenome]